MRPFIRRDRFGYWMVDVARDDPTLYPGTAWGGYDTLPEAMDAAHLARIAEPA